MKSAEWYLNNFCGEEMLVAFDKEDICVSYSGDYRKNVLTQVHNSCELLFVEQGEAEYQINNEIFQVRKNTILIIGATDRHRFRFEKVPYIRYGLTIMPSFLQSLPIISGYINIYQTQNLERSQYLVNLDDNVFQRFIRILWDLREETENGKNRDMVYALLLEMTILLKRLLRMESHDDDNTYRMMTEIKNYIDFHYQEDLSLKELSGRFYLQPNTISKNFRKVWGKNINHYINSVRITHAVRILDDREVSITELAGLVGYKNVNTFLRRFKEKMDVSPLQYRKRFKQVMADSDTRQLFKEENKYGSEEKY